MVLIVDSVYAEILHTNLILSRSFSYEESISKVMDKYKPLYFRPSNIVKAYSIISSNSDSDTILEQRNNTLDWAMNTLINNATALYSIIIAEVERKTGESLDINKHHVEIVDQIAKQFYANTPTVMQYFTDDAVLIEAWTVLCSDIGCNYNI